LHRDGDHRPDRAAVDRRHRRRRARCDERRGHRPRRRGPPPRAPRRRPRDDVRGPRPDPVRRARADRHAVAQLGRRRPLSRPRLRRRPRGPPRRQRRPTRAHGLVIGSAVLVTGLLLVLAALAAGRIPGDAVTASSGSGRSRAFLLSPIQPVTWYANGAIAIGPFAAFLAFGILAAIASIGFTLLFVGVGVIVLGVAIEGARLVARFERRRSFAGEPSRPIAHSYRPLLGVGVLGALRRAFADESRWRDVIYVGVNLPLAFIEGLVVGAGWVLSLALLTSPIWYDAANGTLPLLLQPF